MISDIDYHMQRSRSERDLAYRYGTGTIADAHMALSELHLQRARWRCSMSSMRHWAT
jgi:hypothetical protein